jgi:asparagine synthase (glutamine-hydrolysing)
VFTGEGGDEAFAGYGRYSLSLGRKLAALIDRKGGGIRQSSNWSANAISTCFGDTLKRGRAFRRDAVVDAWRHTDRRWGNVRRRQYVDIQTQLLNSLLVKVDRSTMAYGLEARVPYLDHRVIEFGFSLPDNLKIRGDVRKYFLRRWAERYLPSDYLYRKKTGFGVPDQRILDPATFAAMAQLLPRARAIAEWFDPQGVRKLLQQGRMTAELWSLVYFAVWHRLFVEGRGARPQKEISILGVLGEG